MATLFGTSPRRTLGLTRRVAQIALCWAALAGSACHSRQHDSVYVVVGPEPSSHVEFRPVSSYAEYLVLPGQRRELKITLTSYAASCESFAEPSDHDTSATVTVILPDDSELAAGSFVWAGHEAHGGSEQRPERAYALPTVRLGHHSQTLPPGGEIVLESVATTADGRVRGTLGFEFTGDAERVATSLKGRFEAKLCRVRL